MLLCDLPLDILAIVLGRCLASSQIAADDFKRNLWLLWVCRKWRHAAIPMVYNCVFVTCGDHLEFEEDLHNPLLEAPPDILVKTNLDLIAMVGRARAVKRVHIDVRSLNDPFPWWRDAIQRMRAVASKWRAVELNVATYSKSYEFIHSDRAADQFAGDIAETCDALTTLMPGVNRLEFGESCSNAIAQLLYGRMASLYAKQLLWLDIDDSIIAPPGCQFPRLKRLSLDRLSLAGHQFPQIASGELVDLRFCGGPVNHSWASFSTDSDSQVIEFTNLKRLHAEYSDLFSDNVDSARYQDGHPWELHFPSLESLSISSDQGICNLLEYAVLPPRMESISINMVSAAYEDIEDLVLPVTKHISLRIVVNSARDTSGLAAINRILEDVHECETLKLTIRAHRLEQKLEPYDSTYTALTHLELYATTDVDYMLAIIDNLPNLVELKHSLLDWGELGPEDLDHEVHENEPEPMHASLQTLDIGFHWKERYRGMEVLLVQYLLLGIPTLTKLVSSRTPGIPVRKFVAEYAPRYPHLLSVNLTLNEVADFPESEPELEYSE